MRLNQFRISLLIFCMTFLLPAGYAESTPDKHIEVSLRMIGHRIMLSAQDSTSLVLPIEKEGNSYRIRFGSEFAFNPEELVSTINNAVKETGLAKHYIVEVEQCETGEVVYSYEMNNIDQSDIIPCKSRDLPKDCYSLSFTIIDEGPLWTGRELFNSAIADTTAIENKQITATVGISNIKYWVIALLLILIACVFYIWWRRKSKINTDPNIIQVGGYLFDKQHSELILDGQRIELSSKEAGLLLILYNSANKTVERDVILHKVWGDEGDYVGRTLDVFISKLRKKLEADSTIKIVNIRGVGYKLVAGV